MTWLSDWRDADAPAVGLGDLVQSPRYLDLVMALPLRSGRPIANQKEIDANLTQIIGQLTDHAEKLGIIVKKNGWPVSLQASHCLHLPA